MTEKMAKNICKWISILLVIISLIVFVGGGIKITDKKIAKKIKKEFDITGGLGDDEEFMYAMSYIGITSLEDFEDIDDEKIDRLQEMLDEEEAGIDAEQFVDFLKNGTKIMLCTFSLGHLKSIFG